MSVTEATSHPVAGRQERLVVKGYLLEVCAFTMVNVSEPQAYSEESRKERGKTKLRGLEGDQNLVRIQRRDKCRVNKEQTIQTGISFAKRRHGVIVCLV